MNLLAFLMFQSDTASAPSSAAAAGMGMGMMIVFGLIAVVLIAAMWKIFEKAGEPGWAAIIPIYNVIILLKIAGKPAWWLILFIVPIVNFVIAIIVALAIARNFGKSTGFGPGVPRCHLLSASGVGRRALSGPAGCLKLEMQDSELDQKHESMTRDHQQRDHDGEQRGNGAAAQLAGFV